jgi:hypothetical protein
VAERVEEIVPLLPEAEFTSTIRVTGIENAGWLVRSANSEQRVAAVDLDCWKNLRFSPSRFFEWVDAMIEAGPETLVAAFDELDAEVWIVAMKEMAEFSVAGLGDGSTGHDTTDDGVVYFSATTEENEVRVRQILNTARLHSPSHYWAFVYGAILENRGDCEEYAARWHRGRLGDLGFPDREQAMRAYRPLRVDETPVVDVGRPLGDPNAPAPQPPRRLAGTLVGRALGELPADRAGELLGYVLAVANTLAVADELPLADPESVQASVRKAMRGIDRGLAALARARNQSPAAVLNGTPPLDLFRVGATLARKARDDKDLRPRKTLADLEDEEACADWNLRSETISETDPTLDPDGRLR